MKYRHIRAAYAAPPKNSNSIDNPHRTANKSTVVNPTLPFSLTLSPLSLSLHSAVPASLPDTRCSIDTRQTRAHFASSHIPDTPVAQSSIARQVHDGTGRISCSSGSLTCSQVIRTSHTRARTVEFPLAVPVVPHFGSTGGAVGLFVLLYFTASFIASHSHVSISRYPACPNNTLRISTSVPQHRAFTD